MSVGVRLLEDKVARWNVNGAESARETTLGCTRTVDMPGGRAIPEFGNRILPALCVAPEPQEHVIMPVENCLHYRKTF